MLPPNFKRMRMMMEENAMSESSHLSAISSFSRKVAVFKPNAFGTNKEAKEDNLFMKEL
jgi:hypothetical protein